MKRLFTLLLTVLCILSIIFVMTACNNNSSDTSTDKSSSTSSDTSSDSSGDTTSDTSSDTSSDTNGGTEDEEPLPPVNAELQDDVDALLASKHKLTYNDDGSFRVLVFADLHVTNNATGLQAVKERIKYLVDKEKPNLVIYTGDNVIRPSSEAMLRECLDAIVGYVEEKQIPWCHVYGNHDYDQGQSGAMYKEDQQAIYESYEYCISKDDVSVSTGVGNYVHGIYKKNGALGAVIYFMDSGEYAGWGYNYSYIQEDQISWYKSTSELLQQYNCGTVINGMMAFHIPLVENRDAHANRDNVEIVYDWDGNKREHIHSSEKDTELLETIFERGDVKAIISGHDHRNDYAYNYKGVKLLSCPTISDFGYYEAATQGSRVLDLNANTVGTNIPTYVTYLKERPNPDNYDTLANDVKLEITSEQLQNAYKSDGGYGAVNGTLKTQLKDGKGVDGSEAIELIRSNEKAFALCIETNNKGKLGNNKYLVFWADFTSVEFSKLCFGLVTEDGTSMPYTTEFAKDAVSLYYLADGETEWQEVKTGEGGYFGKDVANSEGVNGKKGYFAISLDSLEYDLLKLSEDSLVVGFYMYGALKDNINYMDKPFYFDDISLVVDYK